MEREGGENRRLTRREFLKLVGATAAATYLTYLKGKGWWVSVLKECLPFSEDPRWEWARKIVVESRFRVEGKEGLEPTVIAVNQFLRKVYGLEEKPVPFAVFEEEEGGWFRIKSPEDYWLRFFNPFAPLGFGLPFSEEIDREEREELSNFNFFLPWVASYPELFKFLQKRNLLGDLGINPEDCFFVPELGFWIIPVDNGLNMKDYRFFPYAKMMVAEGRINSPPFIPVEKYTNWLNEFIIKNPLIPERIKEDLRKICEILEEMLQGKSLVPKLESGFLMDSWQIEGGEKRPSPKNPPNFSPVRIFLAALDPSQTPFKILATSTVVRIGEPKIWGFTERINPFQIEEVDFSILREITVPKFGLRIRTPKTSILPFSEEEIERTAAGILVSRRGVLV